MDAQHVIFASQLIHVTRQTDATCHKSAEFRCYTATPSQRVCPHTFNSNRRSQECCQEQSVAVRNEREVVFFGLIFSMVGVGWEPLLVAQQAGSLVAGHWVLALFLPTVLLGLVQVQHQC